MGERGLALKNLFSYRSLVHAVAGATGSSVAITTFYPFETARTRLQVDDQRKAQYSPAVIAEIFEEEGLRGVYRGWFPVVTSIYCSNFVYFYVFNGLKAIVYGPQSNPTAAKDLLLGLIAGATNVLLTTPLWVANTRLKLQGIKWKTRNDNQKAKHPHYKGIFDCLNKIVTQDGVPALWSGTVASLMLTSNPAVHFMVYDALKRYLQKRLGGKQLSSGVIFVVGALAKLVATFVTYPLQVVQARLRAGQNKTGRGVMAMIQILREIIRAHGLLGVYKGLEAKLTQTILMAALMFLTYEKIASNVFRIMHSQMANGQVKV
ncbi:hypothetical protein NP493_160g03011 [Ridgeia piscesae]|uniref:Peroxisomal membrane protein PMP34 n=1 Tax=Ridgeia piscesae TaxID=27915 RepID=A0AAD9UFR0_RIDPI|nr:hypothetical protein NP493_160g03011 [Ridgeia piscesae]